jgi:hypothetical protein
MKHKDNKNGFNQLFRGGEAVIQSLVSHNIHKNICKTQEGGTSLLMFGPTTDYLDRTTEKRDVSGLRRWSVMTFRGVNIGLVKLVADHQLDIQVFITYKIVWPMMWI